MTFIYFNVIDMKNTLLTIFALFSSVMVFGQNLDNAIYMNDTIDSPTTVESKPATSKDSVKICKDTHVVKHKTITYHQVAVEEFVETAFDTVYMIQYAVVSEITSMPQNSVAMSFYTNEEMMYMVISDKYYVSREEAIAEGEKAKAENESFCFYFVKPCIVPKTSSMVKERDANQQGNYRVQHTWTAMYPTDILENFTVESYQGGFRQVSKQRFFDKADAISWLQLEGLNPADFWIFPIESKPTPLVEKQVVDKVAASPRSEEKSTATEKVVIQFK